MGVLRNGRAASYVIAMQMVLLGGGLGLTTAPASEAIIGSLSADKAGVGSAVNDTTRELGGTLGVAVVGGVFASVYSSRLAGDSVIAAHAVAHLARSMAAAHVIGGFAPDRMADVRAAVNTAFLDGLQIRALAMCGHRVGCGRGGSRSSSRRSCPGNTHERLDERGASSASSSAHR